MGAVAGGGEGGRRALKAEIPEKESDDCKTKILLYLKFVTLLIFK